MHKHGHRSVVARDPQRFQICQRLGQLRTGQTADSSQLIRGDALIGWRVDQVADDIHQLCPPRPCDLRLFQQRFRIIQASHPQRRRENLHAVFLSGQQLRFFQP